MQPMLLQQMKSRSQLVYNKRLDAFTSLCTTLYEIILLCALAVSDSPSLVTKKRQALRASHPDRLEILESRQMINGGNDS